MDIIKALEIIRAKRQRRMDADDGDWITINGTHVMVNKAGGVTKGPKALKDYTKESKSNSHKSGSKLLSPTNKAVNQKIKDIADNDVDGGSEEGANKVAEILDALEPGSTMTIPANSYGDEAYKYKKNKWGQWENEGGDSFSSQTVAWDFLYADENERAFISRVAKSEDERLIAKLKEEAKSWRNQEPIWSGDKPLSENGTIQMRKNDYDLAGDGIIVTGKNGVQYVSWGDGYWRYADGRSGMVDKKLVVGGTVEGDYYTVTYGMNGMPKEEVDKLRSTIESMPKEVRDVYERAFRDHAVRASSEGSSYYSPLDGSVYWDKNSDVETVIHEMTHAFDRYAVDIPTQYGHIGSAAVYMDRLMWADDNKDGVRQDFETMAKVIGYKTDGDGWFANDAERDNAFQPFLDFCRTQDTGMPGFGAVTDALSGMTQDYCGSSIAYGGHSTDYWQRPYGGNRASSQSHEYFANFCALKALGYNDALNLLKTISPNRYEAAEKVYKEVFKNGGQA